jgi:hypothetical protein
VSGICWSASQCPRVALEGDLCPKHTAEKAHAAFVAQWRTEHAIDTWGAPWLCPLCNKAVQDFFALTPCDAQIEIHQESHGKDWLAYQALSASADPQPAPTAGRE